MKKFCEFLRDRAIKIIRFKEKNIKLLAKEQQKSCKNANISCICKEEFENKYLKDKKYHKVGDHCHYVGENRCATHTL